MMFVILGIIILVISFVIALYSLIREQKTPEQDIAKPSEPDLKTHPKTEPPSNAPQPTQAEAGILPTQLPPPPQVSQREPFPWEENPPQVEQREDNVEAKIWQNQPKVDEQPPQEEKLIGEISLKDIPKTNDQ